MVQSVTPLSPNSTIGSSSSKKNNLLNLFSKRKGGSKSGNSGSAGDVSKPSRLGSLKSTIGSRSRSKGDKLQKISTRGSSRSRKRDLSEGRDFYVDDGDSLLYNDEDDDDEDIGDDTNTLGYASDTSLGASIGRSPSMLSRIKSNGYNNKRSSTILNHNVDEKVAFPNLDQIIRDSNMILPITSEEEAPWNGLTYESFLIPKYVKTSRHTKKSPKIINNLFLAQELNVDNYKANNASIKSNESSDTEQDHLNLHLRLHLHLESEEYASSDNPGYEKYGIGKEVFVMKFSKDGKYLAAAGRDAVIRIWKVISSPLGRLEYNQNERDTSPVRSNKRDAVFDSAPVFHKTPIELRGHTSGIISLAWSKNNFLITGSMDKTAKLWHVDRPNCLQTFQHQDFVTSVEFHPLDDRFFLSGSLDNEVRLWSILEKSVSYWRNLGEEVLVTALAFTPDGLHCMVGGFNGSIFVLETKGLHVVHRAEIKERSIVHAFHERGGNKITGIEVFHNPNHDPANSNLDVSFDQWNVLITTNDSRVRMISTAKKKLITRFKGLTNTSSSIAASITQNHKYIISGSEDHYCYVWENNNRIINNKIKQSLKEFVIDGKQTMSDFHHKHEKYSKLFHSNKLIGKLLDSGSDDENLRHDFVANENNSYACFHAHHSRCNVAVFAPDSTKTLLGLSDDLIFDLKKRGEACKMDPSLCASAAAPENYGKECARFDEGPGEGDIIVTTDQYGLIRVFRQDVASSYRRQFIDLYKKCHAQNKSSVLLSPESNSIKSSGANSLNIGGGGGGSVNGGAAPNGGGGLGVGVPNGSIGHNFRPSRKLLGSEKFGLSRNFDSSRSISSILSSKRGLSATDISQTLSHNGQYRPHPVPSMPSSTSTSTIKQSLTTDPFNASSTSSNYTYQRQRAAPLSPPNHQIFNQPDIPIHLDPSDEEEDNEFDHMDSDATSTTEIDNTSSAMVDGGARRKGGDSYSTLSNLESANPNGPVVGSREEVFPSLKKVSNQQQTHAPPPPQHQFPHQHVLRGGFKMPAPPVTPPAGNQMHHAHPPHNNSGFGLHSNGGNSNSIPRGSATATSATSAGGAPLASPVTSTTPTPTPIQSSSSSKPYPVSPKPVPATNGATSPQVPQIILPDASSPSPSPSPMAGQPQQHHQPHQPHHHEPQLTPDLHSQISRVSIHSTGDAPHS